MTACGAWCRISPRGLFLFGGRDRACELLVFCVRLHRRLRAARCRLMAAFVNCAGADLCFSSLSKTSAPGVPTSLIAPMHQSGASEWSPCRSRVTMYVKSANGMGGDDLCQCFATCPALRVLTCRSSRTVLHSFVHPLVSTLNVHKLFRARHAYEMHVRCCRQPLTKAPQLQGVRRSQRQHITAKGP